MSQESDEAQPVFCHERHPCRMLGLDCIADVTFPFPDVVGDGALVVGWSHHGHGWTHSASSTAPKILAKEW